jgi:hypothetical protein
MDFYFDVEEMEQEEDQLEQVFERENKVSSYISKVRIKFF